MSAEAPRHIADETLTRWACNELTAAEQAEVVAHLEQCEDCARVWQAVEKVRQAAVEFDPGAVAPLNLRWTQSPRAMWRRLRRPAAAVAAAAAFLMWMQWPRPTDPSLGQIPADQATVTAQVVRSISLPGPIPLSPVESSRGQARQFSWQGVDGATGFSVELLDAQGELIWTSERLTELTAPWPASAETKAGQYFWRVSAHFEDGEEPISSPLISFELI